MTPRHKESPPLQKDGTFFCNEFAPFLSLSSSLSQSFWLSWCLPQLSCELLESMEKTQGTHSVMRKDVPTQWEHSDYTWWRHSSARCPFFWKDSSARLLPRPLRNWAQLLQLHSLPDPTPDCPWACGFICVLMRHGNGPLATGWSIFSSCKSGYELKAPPVGSGFCLTSCCDCCFLVIHTMQSTCALCDDNERAHILKYLRGGVTRQTPAS